MSEGVHRQGQRFARAAGKAEALYQAGRIHGEVDELNNNNKVIRSCAQIESLFFGNFDPLFPLCHGPSRMRSPLSGCMVTSRRVFVSSFLICFFISRIRLYQPSR